MKSPVKYLQYGWLLMAIYCLLGWGSSPLQAQSRKAKSKVEKDTLTRGVEESVFTEGMKFMMMDEPSKAIPQFEKVIQLHPENSAAQFALATAYMKQGKADKALPYATKAVQMDGGSNKYYVLQLAELYVKQKRYTDAEKLYEELIRKSPDNIEYGVELAAIYLFNDKPDKALEAYDQVEKSLGRNDEIVRQKQRIYLKQNKVEKAIEEAEKLVASEPGETDYLLEGAELLLANERTDQAINWLQRALKINAELPQAHVMLADIYRRKGDLQKSKQELDIVLSNPNLESDLKARILSSYIRMTEGKEGDKQSGLKMAQDLVKANPKDAKSQIIYADLLMQQGDKAGARNHYVQAAKLDKSVYEVWGAILQLDGELNQFDSLLVHSEQALEVFPNQGLFWLSNGFAHYAKKNFQESVSSLEEAKRLLSSASNPDMAKYLNGINAQLGDAYNGLGDHKKSDEAYELALKEDPNNEHVLNNYSYFLSLRKEKLPLALQMSERLVERNQSNATYLDTHAWVLYIMKDYTKARQFLEKALQDEKNASGTVIEHYGDVLFQLGEREKAVEQWKKAKQKGETSDRLDKKIATGRIYE
ncbi:tetratricopeptide repeat protein [Tellurirhabdus bombi]|uniref:tetratricopeptide repeat protein n=1 Tax=Tellurirhabdus bombi TaxID=2907205 RepID=UPI001F1E3FA4|nr:tetratricopeptide repeat protein [Tellurirhabdus bombi]